MYQITANTNAMQLHTNFIDKHGMDMSNYPNVLTPPMDSPDSIMLSPSSGSCSPHQTYIPPGIVQPYSFTANTMQVQGRHPQLTILEQPVDRFRFRYKSEMAGTHGSLNGKSSDRSRKQTYPTVELHNYDKHAVVRCSLYQFGREEMLHTRQPHAHRLVKKHGSEEIDDPHDMILNADSGYVANFHSMGIIHTAKKYIVPELMRKNTKLKEEEIARTEHKCRQLSKKEELEIKLLAEKESKSINLNIVCLRFDAFKVINNIFYPLCEPVYSHSINNLKSALTGDLKIVRMDHCTSPSRGGREIFILVEKVTKKNIKVRFYELDDEDNEIWSDYGRFSDLDVHHQYAIVFKTPPYKSLDIDRQMKVFIELQRPSDGARSEPKDFTYIPCEITLGRKRARSSSNCYSSSNFSSDELPLTISHMPMNGQVMNDLSDMNTMVVNSAELEEALKHGNINSAEFDVICESILNSSSNLKNLYVEDAQITNEDFMSLQMDAPQLSYDRVSVDVKPNVTPMVTEMKQSKYMHEYASPMNKLSAKEQKIVDRVKKQLVDFIKTTPAKKRVAVMLENLFQNESYISETGNTVLHLLVSENNSCNNFLLFLLKVLLKYQQTDLINICNKNGQTALHLAVDCRNLTVIDYLMYTNVDVSLQDVEGNTALHVAVNKSVPITIFKLLLSPGSEVQKYIDLKNYDGHTALHLAVKLNNIPATKLLCWNHTNVNEHDNKNGYTALHIAVADQHLDIINFLLESTEIEPNKEDYRQYSALKFAKVLIQEDKPKTKEIYDVIENFMKRNGSFEEVDIKEEVEEMSDEEMDEFKEEPMSPDVKNKYDEVKVFTEECLSEVAAILDKSGTWQNLADLLDYGHILRSTNLFNNMEKPSRSLLEFAMANGDSVVQIRDFLENLDELKAVELIDKMIREEY